MVSKNNAQGSDSDDYGSDGTQGINAEDTAGSKEPGEEKDGGEYDGEFGKDKYDIDDGIFMARTAELSGNLDDMAKFVKKVMKVKLNQKAPDENEEGKTIAADYTKRERDTIAVSFKNQITNYRVAIRIVKALMENEKYRRFENGLKEYKIKMEKEIYDTCENIVGTVRNHCLDRPGNSKETQVYFQKLLGDHYRYMAEAAE